MTYLGGEPVVELGDPVVQRVYGDNAQHLLGGRILQEHVDERDDLNKKITIRNYNLIIFKSWKAHESNTRWFW